MPPLHPFAPSPTAVVPQSMFSFAACRASSLSTAVGQIYSSWSAQLRRKALLVLLPPPTRCPPGYTEFSTCAFVEGLGSRLRIRKPTGGHICHMMKMIQKSETATAICDETAWSGAW